MKITILVSGSILSNFSYRALALARALSAQGYAVSVIAPKADKYNNFVAENINSIDKVRILQPFQFTTKHSEINLFPYMFGAMRLVLREKPDLIYIYKPTPATIVGFMAKLFRGTPVVLDMDDLGSEVMRIEGHPRHQRVLVEWCERIAARYADRIVAASTYLRDMYASQFPGKPIHIMPNGVGTEWFGASMASEYSRRIVFMGAINRRNILDPLFDALPEVLRAYPDTKILIIGDGLCLEYFKDKSNALGIASHIEFAGWLTIDKARARLRAGDIGYCYMPDGVTNRAASNMKVPQYMACGVVPLVSDIGDLPGTVEFGAAGYVAKADNLREFVSILLHALGDPARMEKSKLAIQAAKRRFNWNDLATGMAAWLRSDKKARKTGKHRIYFVSTTVPGNVGGGEIRNYNIIKQMARQSDADLEVFCISPKDAEAERMKFESSVRAHCHISTSATRTSLTVMRAILLKRVPPFMDDFESSGLGLAFRKACEQSLPNAVHIEQIHAYYCIRPHIKWLKSRGVKIVFDCHNIEYRNFEDSLDISSVPKKIVGRYLAPHMKKMEIEAATEADAVLACSAVDADFFKQYNQNTFIIPNGVDCSEFKPHDKVSDPTLVFMGGVGYPPNGDGLRFYIESIHPKVQKLAPRSTLLAIGADKNWLDSVMAESISVKPLGFVDDVRPYLEKASIGICPIRYGSGTRIKILTYIAAGLPVVSTRKGAEGVGYTSGQNIVITDDPQEFADAIGRLLTDRPYYDKIATGGLDFIRAHYDWDVIGKDLARIYHNETR